MSVPEVLPTDPFDRLVTPQHLADGRFVASIPPEWQQGRGAFGGLPLGLMVRAAEGVVATRDPDRTLRSLTAELLGPVEPGPVELGTEVLRWGNGVTSVAVRLTQSGAVLAHAVAVLGRPRATLPDGTWLSAPPLPSWRHVSAANLSPPAAPRFSEHWEYRVVGPVPFASGYSPIATGWVRPRNPGGARDAAYLVACADAFWPSFFSIESAPRPVGTIAYTFQVAGTCAGLDPEAPLAYRARTMAAREGFAVEQRELWGEDGRLLALNQQTVVAIR